MPAAVAPPDLSHLRPRGGHLRRGFHPFAYRPREREPVWKELDRCFHTGQRILELNCGTGVDAIHLAERGIDVLACDVAPRMIQVARQRLGLVREGKRVDFRVLATEEIAVLADQGPFDGAFSNFAGLNCVADLSKAASDLANLLAPGATVLLCMAGRSVAWEIVWYLGQGKLRKALRRFELGGTVGRLAEGVIVKVHYPTVRMMAQYRPGISPGAAQGNWRRRTAFLSGALCATLSESAKSPCGG